MDISASFSCVSLVLPSNSKMQFNDLGRVPAMWKHPSDDLMSFLGELECLHVCGTFPLKPDVKISPEFRVDSRFTYNPSFRVYHLHQHPPSRVFPQNPRYLARWACTILPYLVLCLILLLGSICAWQGEQTLILWFSDPQQLHQWGLKARFCSTGKICAAQNF